MEEQPPATVSVATGALGPILEKLTTLLGDEQHISRLGTEICDDIKSIRSKLASLHSLLLRIWEREDLGTPCKDWMTEARAQSYNMEDDIDDLMLGLERSDIGHGELNKFFQNIKKRVDDVSRQCREEWKTTTAPYETASNKPSPADARALFLHKDASELVGMDRPFLELQQLLRSGDHEVVCIHGFAGTGKTTLADMVFQKIGNEFECRAFVSLSKSPDMLEVLGAILTQVTQGVQSAEITCTEATSEENLIHDISMALSGKRYLVIVDDIWLWQSWEIIRRTLPKGNRLCRIIATTRILAIAEKCLTEEGAAICRHSGIDAQAAFQLSSRILEQDHISWGFHPEVHMGWGIINDMIGNMCGGMTLAVRCLSSSIKFKLWMRDYNDDESALRELWHVLLDGILCNNRELMPIAESLRLGYDDLPVHFKTCLLYCSIFPTGYQIERNGLVRKWITHEFFPKGTEQEKPEAAAEACLDELVSRGLLQQQELASSSLAGDYLVVHPMMRAFLLWRSRKANFATCLELPPHDCPPSYAAVSRPLYVGFHAAPNTISAMPGPSRARSLTVFGYFSSSSSRTDADDGCLIPWQKLQRVRVLSIEDKSVPLGDTDLVAICTRMLRLRHLGLKGMMAISVVPPEIEGLQNLETLDISDTGVREVPKQIGKLHHLKILNLTTMVAELPWLSSGSVTVLADGVKLPPGILDVMQSVKPREEISIVLHARPGQLLPVPGLRVGSRRYIRFPNWIKEHLAEVSLLDIRLCELEDDDLEFLRTMPNLQLLTLRLPNLSKEPSVLPEGTGFSRLESFCLDGHNGHVRVPGWVKQHLANVSSLDIRLRQLVNDDLDFLRNEMPHLQLLTLRLDVLRGKGIVIKGEGFLTLKSFCFDCRLPLVTFRQGAMPKLEHLEFKFYASRALRSEDSMGIRHLLCLERVVFQSSPRYKSDAPGISSVINKVREEAKEHRNRDRITISINGKDEKATTTSASSDRTSEENNVSKNGGAGGSSGACVIQTRPPVPYNTVNDDDKMGNIIPVKSYYPFGVTK